MKEENKLTQLYENAFKDFSVEAPEATYAKVQKQLGRKSLLTLDPTRLNVFYLALVSGVVAWAIIGNKGSEKAEVEDVKDIKQISLALDETASIKERTTSAEEISSDVTETVSYETVIAENTAPKPLVKATRNYAPPKPVLVAEEEVVETPDVIPIEILEEEMPSEELGETPELEVPEGVIPTEEFSDIEERIEEREMKVLTNAQLENPLDFLRRLKFERDNSVPYAVKTKSNKK